MNLVSENVSRKIDSLGRIGIPKGIRDRLRLEVNDEMEFFTMTDDAGEQFICLSAHKGNGRYAIAREVLEELGLEVPEQLAVMPN